MADKTEDPTPKRLREARKKGQIAKSQDLTNAFLFLTAFSMLIAMGGRITESLKALMKKYIDLAVTPNLTTDAYAELGVDLIWTLLGIILPLLAANFVVALFISFVQVGSIFSPEQLKPKFDKLNPLNKLKQWFGPQAAVELIKSAIKLSAICFLMYQILRASLRTLVLSVGSDVANIGIFLQDLVSSFTVRVAVLFLVIAAGDYFFQKKQLMKQLKMSKDEVKREYKEEEGDPLIKSKRKQMHQEFVFNNMMRNVKKASVVVVNPTSIAVALYYDREKGGAPQVIARGERLVADKIRELAKEYGLPIMRNVSLAQALNKVDIGEEIPEELYEAVAEVLNFVYRMSQGQKR